MAVKLSSRDKKEINRLRKLFPSTIKVKVLFSKDGGFYAEIFAFKKKFVTQAETFPELIEMVSDAIATVLEIPKKYLPYMPTYLPPVSVAQRLGLYPLLKWKSLLPTTQIKS